MAVARAMGGQTLTTVALLAATAAVATTACSVETIDSGEAGSGGGAQAGATNGGSPGAGGSTAGGSGSTPEAGAGGTRSAPDAGGPGGEPGDASTSEADAGAEAPDASAPAADAGADGGALGAILGNWFICNDTDCNDWAGDGFRLLADGACRSLEGTGPSPPDFAFCEEAPGDCTYSYDGSRFSLSRGGETFDVGIVLDGDGADLIADGGIAARMRRIDNGVSVGDCLPLGASCTVDAQCGDQGCVGNQCTEL